MFSVQGVTDKAVPAQTEVVPPEVDKGKPGANRLVDDRCWNCKFPLTGVLDPCDHGKRCRVNEERVECGFVYGRVKCELGGNCDARFEEHFFDYIH